MLYYQPKKDYYFRNKVGMKKDNYSFIEGELLTISELNRIFKEDYLEKVIEKYFTIRNINKNNTYWLFGCRWESKKGGD